MESILGPSGLVFDVKNGDLPQNATWGPPPRNQNSNPQKTTVEPKSTGFPLYLGTISGNQFVITSGVENPKGRVWLPRLAKCLSFSRDVRSFHEKALL
jgi:hypothetical protein